MRKSIFILIIVAFSKGYAQSLTDANFFVKKDKTTKQNLRQLTAYTLTVIINKSILKK